MVGEGDADLGPERSTGQELGVTTEPTCGHAFQRDGPDLVTQDDGVESLTGVASRDGDLARVSGLPPRDGPAPPKAEDGAAMLS